jgi:hypothetical protein
MRKSDRLQRAQNQAENQARSEEKAPAKKSGGRTQYSREQGLCTTEKRDPEH